MSEDKVLRIGTRGSALALAQAEMTERALQDRYPDLQFERIIIKTTGDKRTDVALKDVAASEGVVDKGVFIKELEVALENNEIDIAVHSLKDVPTVLENQFEIPAVLERAPVGDILVCKGVPSLAELPEGAIVATSSVRRSRQLLWMRDDLEVVDIRGNVPTRLRKLAESSTLNGTILAEAGLKRLGYDLTQPLNLEGAILYFERLDEEEFLPAAGQGAVAFEIRTNDDWSRGIVEGINHAATFTRVVAERRFLELLDAGCHTPVGVNTELDDSGQLLMNAAVYDESDLSAPPKKSSTKGAATEPLVVAEILFQQLS